jgi:hypothetical protein
MFRYVSLKRHFPAGIVGFYHVLAVLVSAK